MAANQKDEKDLVADLEALGFTWERTRNGHIKAVAPDGKTFTFSTGGGTRSVLNQAARLRRWKREYNVSALNPAEEEQKTGTVEEISWEILAAVDPDQQFDVTDIHESTNYTVPEIQDAIEYLIELEMFEKVEGQNTYRVVNGKESVAIELSPVAITVVEAMVEAIRKTLGGEEIETYKTANEALRSKSAKDEQKISDLWKEVADLNAEISAFNSEISSLNTEKTQLMDQFQILKLEVDRLTKVEEKFIQFERLFKS